jgi:hypothetical protein
MNQPSYTRIKETDIKNIIDLEAKKTKPFRTTEAVKHTHTFKILEDEFTKIITFKDGDFKSSLLKDASPTDILNILKSYYSSNINNNSSKLTREERMRDTLTCILLIRIIENVINIYSKNPSSYNLPLFNQFIDELHSKFVFPLNATTIVELIAIMNEAITAIDKLFNSNVTQIESNVTQIEITNSLTFTILELVSKLSAHKEYIQKTLENIKTTLETEVEKINNGYNEEALSSRPVTASRPVTRRSGRQNGGKKSKLNSTRKKHKKTN